jgi:hypothetical protein
LTKPGTHQQAPTVDRSRYARRAEAICRRSVAAAQAVGRVLPEAVSRAASPQVGITTALVRPGVEILSREAAALRSLGPGPRSTALQTYLGLFEPIVELAHQRLQAGLASEFERARELEVLIAGLADEQSTAARRYGFHACSIEFTRALGRAE